MNIYSQEAREDPRQHLRMQRNLMAAGTSALVILLLFSYHLQGFLAKSAFIAASASIIFLVILFYLIFRTGLNKRFSDPSLTTQQMISAVVVIAFVVYQAGEARGALLLAYIMVFEFGVFRLDTRRLLAISTVVLLLHTFMILASAAAEDTLGESARLMIEWLVLAVVLIWFAFIGGYISNIRQALRELSVKDELTGLRNRRYIREMLRMEKARADRTGNAFSVAILDIDHFKKLNDTFGHAVGDSALVAFARLIASEIRVTDYLARQGGEEFIVLLTYTPLTSAPVLAERLRRRVEAHHWGGLPAGCRMTVSIGLAQYRPSEEISALLERADRALYEAKQGGRNRLVSARELALEEARA